MTLRVAIKTDGPIREMVRRLGQVTQKIEGLTVVEHAAHAPVSVWERRRPGLATWNISS